MFPALASLRAGLLSFAPAALVPQPRAAALRIFYSPQPRAASLHAAFTIAAEGGFAAFPAVAGGLIFLSLFPALASLRAGLLSFAPAALVPQPRAAALRIFYSPQPRAASLHAAFTIAAEGGFAAFPAVAGGLIFLSLFPALVWLRAGLFSFAPSALVPQPRAAALHAAFTIAAEGRLRGLSSRRWVGSCAFPYVSRQLIRCVSGYFHSRAFGAGSAAEGGCAPRSFHHRSRGAASRPFEPSLRDLFLCRSSRHLLRCVPGYFHSRLRRWSIAIGTRMLSMTNWKSIERIPCIGVN